MNSLHIRCLLNIDIQSLYSCAQDNTHLVIGHTQYVNRGLIAVDASDAFEACDAPDGSANTDCCFLRLRCLLRRLRFCLLITACFSFASLASNCCACAYALFPAPDKLGSCTMFRLFASSFISIARVRLPDLLTVIITAFRDSAVFLNAGNTC